MFPCMHKTYKKKYIDSVYKQPCILVDVSSDPEFHCEALQSSWMIDQSAQQML